MGGTEYFILFLNVFDKRDEHAMVINAKYKGKLEKSKWRKVSFESICGGVIVRWAGKYKCMEHNRIFSDVMFEGNWRPPAGTLDQFRNSTSLCHSSCATSTQRLARYIGPKIAAKMLDEPSMQGNGPISFKPKLQVEGEKCVLWFDVVLHDWLGVSVIDRKSVV